MLSIKTAKEILHEEVISVSAILKGWSADVKFMVEGEYDTYLIRVSEIASHDKKKKEFAYMKKTYDKGIHMQKPTALVVKNEAVYTVLTYIRGKDMEDILKELDRLSQYEYGLKSGEILQKIHEVHVEEAIKPWYERYREKTLRNIENFRQCGIEIENSDRAISFLMDNMEILRDRPQVFQHGDYHIGNMICDERKELAIIDFNRMDFGDPYEEFNRLTAFTRRISIPFSIGQIEGYFNSHIPEEFFRYLAFYSISNALGAIPWAIPYGKKDVETMMEITRTILTDFNLMTDCIPVWFKR